MDFSESEQFRAAVNNVLASDPFLRSPALCRLLAYLVEQVIAGEAASLKESVIGHELYARPASYDPKLDSVVRVSANRLRVRLEEYYRANPGERVRLVLPKGSYVPVLEVSEAVPVRDVVGASREDGAGESIPAPPGSESSGQAKVDRSGAPAAAASKPGLRMFIAGLVIVSMAVALLTIVFWTHARRQTETSADLNWSVRPFARLGGSQQFGAFSPDGTQLAFTSTTTQDANKAIYIQPIATEEARRVAAGVRPAWSPDGKRIAFLRPEANGRKQVVIYTLATGSETIAAELENLGLWMCQISRLSWSADGGVLYTGASIGKNSTCELLAIDVTSHHIQPLLKPGSVAGDMEPVVSPDGANVAFLSVLAAGASDIFVVSTHGGQPRRITHDGADIYGFDWVPDGKALIVASNREGGTRKLWRVPVAGGVAQSLTDGSSSPTYPSVNANGREINFTQFHVTAPIWEAAAGKTAVLLDNQSGNNAPSVAPDGKKLLYTSDRAGSRQVWLSRADGSESRPLLPASAHETGAARWSPDGSLVVMECHLAKSTHICISNADGSGVRQLTSGSASQVMPSWTRDGKAIYFTSASAGQEDIYRITVAGGTADPVTHQGGKRALESWDGKWLYVACGRSGGMIALPLQGTEQERRSAENNPMLPELRPESGSGWDVSRAGVVYLAPGDSPTVRLDVFDAQTRTSRAFLSLGELAAKTDFSLSVFPDGRGVVFTATRTHSELSMMSARR